MSHDPIKQQGYCLRSRRYEERQRVPADRRAHLKKRKQHWSDVATSVKQSRGEQSSDSRHELCQGLEPFRDVDLGPAECGEGRRYLDRPAQSISE
jgi:hypothetical protein